MCTTDRSFDGPGLQNTIRLLRFYVPDLRITADELAKLAEDGAAPTLESAALNPDAPQDLLRALSRTGFVELRERVAANPSAPNDVLASLASDDDWRVRRNVGRNPSSSEGVLEMLSSRGQLLLDELAAQIGISADALVKYCKGLTWRILDALAWNPSTPRDMLRILAEHGFDRGERPAADHRREYLWLLELSAGTGYADRMRAALDPSTPEDVLMALAHDEESMVRRSVALNPAAPEGVFTLLAQGDDDDRRCVAESPFAPEGVVRGLMEDALAIRQAVEASPYVTGELICHFESDEKDPVLDAVVRNPSVSEGILRRLAKVDDWSVRYLIAYQPATPADVMQALANDEDPRVREGVADATGNPEMQAQLSGDEYF